MNLSTAMTIEAGGQGSGCNPRVGKCGRPPEMEKGESGISYSHRLTEWDRTRKIESRIKKMEPVLKEFKFKKSGENSIDLIYRRSNSERLSIDKRTGRATIQKTSYKGVRRNTMEYRTPVSATTPDTLRNQLKELFGGGPGSGCHGENCGRPAENLVKDADKSSWRNPLDERERIVNNNAAIEIRVTGENKISLQAIRSFEKGKGHGTKALEWLLKLADKHGVTIEADVQPFMTKDKGLNKKNLMAWYKRHGFEKKMGDWVERKPKS